MSEGDQQREMEEIVEDNLCGDGEGKKKLSKEQQDRVKNRILRNMAPDGYLGENAARMFENHIVGEGLSADIVGGLVATILFYSTGFHLERDLNIPCDGPAVRACLRRYGLFDKCFPREDDDEDDEDDHDGGGVYQY